MADAQEVVIPKMDLRDATVHLVGTTPLISHAWSQKSKQMMRDQQMKKARQAKAAKDPEAEYMASRYCVAREPDVDGFPIVAFKAAAAASWSMVDSLKKAAIRGAFHLVNGEPTVQGDLVRLDFETVRLREDMVRVGMGVADLRYRAEYGGWAVDLEVRYNARIVSIEQIVTILDVAGFSVGVGEWRPGRGGTFGQFRVEGVS